MMPIVGSGLINKWMKDHRPKEGNKCDQRMSSVRQASTKLKDVFGLYLVLLVGITVASVVLVLELMSKRYCSLQIKPITNCSTFR